MEKYAEKGLNPNKVVMHLELGKQLLLPEIAVLDRYSFLTFQIENCCCPLYWVLTNLQMVV